jgi:hypothetical protein
VGWKDADEDYPIRYSLAWVNDTFIDLSASQIKDGLYVGEYSLSDRQNSTTITTVLPNGPISLVCRCFDSLGAATRQLRSVSVRPLPNLFQVGDSVAIALTTNSTWESLNYISAISFVLNYTQATEVQDIKISFVEKLISIE